MDISVIVTAENEAKDVNVAANNQMRERERLLNHEVGSLKVYSKSTRNIAAENKTGKGKERKKQNI